MKTIPSISKRDVNRLWLQRQWLSRPRDQQTLTRDTLVQFLESVGALQVDSVNVLERAHYLTLWSRFGVYDKEELDRWIYEERLAYEYWGHEASILPMSQLPHSRRRMRSFPPPSWLNSAWWKRYVTSDESMKRSLQKIKKEGSLQSLDFERIKNSDANDKANSFAENIFTSKEDKRSLHLLWHQGKLGIDKRSHFRKHYNLANRIYPESSMSTVKAYQESWLINGLRGNGFTTLGHLNNYFTAPVLAASEKRTIINRLLKNKSIIKIQVENSTEEYYGLPEHLDQIHSAPQPIGTTLICPFDSLLWQRKRAEELLDFKYRVEIYVPPKKRIFGYYMMPILHNGQLVGRIDPKLHRKEKELEIVSKFVEPAFKISPAFNAAFRQSIDELATFVGAKKIRYSTKWLRRKT